MTGAMTGCGRAPRLRLTVVMKTLIKVAIPLAISVVAAAACSSSYPGVTNVQPACLAWGQTCYYGSECCSLKCLNNVCLR